MSVLAAFGLACIVQASMGIFLWLLVTGHERERNRFFEAAQGWTEERRELLNRIQRPEHMPLPSVSWAAPEDGEPDSFDEVGTITYLEDAAA